MKTIASALCAALMLGFTACGQPAEQPKTDDTIITDNTQIPNPWQDYDSLSDACDAAGYDFVIPESLDGHDGIHFSVLGDGEITIRKAPGAEDISGDYNTYESTEKVTVGGHRGDAQGQGRLYPRHMEQRRLFLFPVAILPPRYVWLAGHY